VLRRSRRLLAGLLAVLLAAPAVAVGTAGVAQADVVRAQELWVLNALNVPTAWQTTMGRGVTVGLIDSGVNGSVSDLAGSVTRGRDFTGVNTLPSNPHWGVHGTWMASLIGGHGHPAGGPNGIIGVAPRAHILSIRAVTDQGDPGGRRYDHESEAHVQGGLAAAISYAAKQHVQVISMSLGYQGASLPVRVAIKDALAKGIVVVASSGNSGGVRSSHGGNAPYSFPADYPGVLGVGAVGRGGTPAHFSSNNLSVEVAAPGVKVPAQGRDGQYWLVSGTSPACALTAGVAALIKSRYPSLPPALVVQAITASTWHRPRGGYNEEVGFGTVDAAAALRMAARLVHDSGTGQGQAEAVRFGGGLSASPPLPVAPRGKRQLIIDIMLALVCLALLAGSAFWLIVTRGGAADAGRPAGGSPAGYGPPAGLHPPDEAAEAPPFSGDTGPSPGQW
jgi:subtilisin family serine protease